MAENAPFRPSGIGAMPLRPRRVEKTWGRRDLPAPFRSEAEDACIGEIVFDDPHAPDAALLVKYLFTSERLSVQVHPDDQAARAAGFRSGKDEAWVVIAAEPGATIATGLKRAVSRDALRESALDGSIVDLLDWQPAAAGEAFYSPAGTIHAIGPGVSLVEVQQNVDVTYRLFDYGRPRELHLDEGLAVARLEPAGTRQQCLQAEPGRELVAVGPALRIERLSAGSGRLPARSESPIWLIPLEGDAGVEGHTAWPGEVWLLDAPGSLRLGPRSSALIAGTGAIGESFWSPLRDDS